MSMRECDWSQQGKVYKTKTTFIYENWKYSQKIDSVKNNTKEHKLIMDEFGTCPDIPNPVLNSF